MEQKVDNELINKFWIWFLGVEKSLRENLEHQDILDQLDEQVGKMGDFSWEIGPGYKSDLQLTISPSGNKELLQATKQIVSLAPDIPNWEYFFAKQPRQSTLNFIIHTDKGSIDIDASFWKYVLLRFPDDTFDIIVLANNLMNLSEDERYWAVEVALDGIIGEEKRLQLIDGIDIVDKFEDEYRGKESSFKDLLNHLKQYW